MAIRNKKYIGKRPTNPILFSRPPNPDNGLGGAQCRRSAEAGPSGRGIGSDIWIGGNGVVFRKRRFVVDTD